MTIPLLLVLLAFMCFLLGTAQVPARFNWIALGLAFYMLSLLVGPRVVP